MPVYSDLVLSDTPLLYLVGAGAATLGGAVQVVPCGGVGGAWSIAAGPLAPTGNASVSVGPSPSQSYAGAGPYLAVSGGVAFPAGGAAWSMEAWWNCAGFNLSYGGLPYLSHGVLLLWHTTGPTSGTPLRYVGVGSTVPFNPASLNTWHHEVSTSSGPPDHIISTYVDGALHDAGPFSLGSDSLVPDTLLIGVQNVNGCPPSSLYYPFSGQIADAAVYDYALAPCQVLNHYQAATLGTWSPCAGEIGPPPKLIRLTHAPGTGVKRFTVPAGMTGRVVHHS